MYDLFEAADKIGVDSDVLEMCLQINRCEPFPTDTPLITEAGIRNAKTVLGKFGQAHFSFCDSLYCLDYPKVSIKS